MKVIFVFLIISLPVMAETYYEEHATGWHWYKEEIEKKKKPTEYHQNTKETVELALNEAVMEPTESNVKRYIELQNEAVEKASAFSRAWKKVLMKYPFLDYSNRFPNGQLAKQVHLDEKRQEGDKQLRYLSKEYGLIYFFNSHCPYCEKFAKIIKDVTYEYGFSLMPVSIDGKPGAFETYYKDKGQAAALNIESVPVVMAVSGEKFIRVSSGLISEEELKERLMMLSQVDNKVY